MRQDSHHMHTRHMYHDLCWSGHFVFMIYCFFFSVCSSARSPATPLLKEVSSLSFPAPPDQFHSNSTTSLSTLPRLPTHLDSIPPCYPQSAISTCQYPQLSARLLKYLFSAGILNLLLTELCFWDLGLILLDSWLDLFTGPFNCLPVNDLCMDSGFPCLISLPWTLSKPVLLFTNKLPHLLVNLPVSCLQVLCLSVWSSTQFMTPRLQVKPAEEVSETRNKQNANPQPFVRT